MNLEKILTYKEYFKECFMNDHEPNVVINKTSDNHFTLPYFQKEETLQQFVTDFYDSDIVIPNYVRYLEERNIKNIKEITSYDDFTNKDLLAILTTIVRGDRMNEGFLIRKASDGTIYQLLKHLSEKE